MNLTKTSMTRVPYRRGDRSQGKLSRGERVRREPRADVAPAPMRRPPRWALSGLVFLVALLLPGAPRSAQAAVLPRAADIQAQNSISYDAATQRYELVSQAARRVVYQVTLTDQDLTQGMLRVTAAVDRGPFHVIVAQAGTRYKNSSGQILQPEAYEPTAGAQLAEHRIDGQTLVLRFTEQPGSRVLEKTYRLSLQGQSLKIEFSSPATWCNDGYAGLSLGHTEPEADARVVDLPYLPVPLVLLSDGSVLSAYLDPTVSHSSDMLFLDGIDEAGRIFAHSVSTITPDTAGNCQALQETAYVTLAEEMSNVFPVSEHAASLYYPALSDRLVLDVWGLHHDFGVPEGVAYAWQAPQAGSAHLTLETSDANASCGDGVVVELRHGQELLKRIILPNGLTQDQTWEGDVTIQSGDWVTASVSRRGNNACDATNLRLTIDLNGTRFDSTDGFSSVQGQGGWHYLEFLMDRQIPMTWDDANQRWQGSTSFSLLWRGGGHPGQGATSFLDAQNMVRRYAEYGLTRLAIIFHVWQHWGYDEGLPDHYPANPNWGSQQDMASFVATAKAEGMLVALHENYTDMYPDNPPDHPSPLWDPSAIALDPNGNWKTAWLNEATGQQAFRISADRMEGFARQQDQLISTAYQPNASYLDVTPGWSPAMSLDYDASKNAVPTLAHAYDRMVSLFDAMHESYPGPLFGEGGEGPRRFDTFFAGAVDGVERQVEGRWQSLMAPDYELQNIKPRMFNHGMGYYARYFEDEARVVPSLDELDMDRYRATELAYGHAGFLGDGVRGDPSWLDLHVPEYWLVQAVQSRYADRAVFEVAYWDGTGFLDLETALRNRLALDRAKLRITYSGLTLWVNRDAAEQLDSSILGFSHEQGQAGWSYYEDLGSGLQPMHWDPSRGRWQGSGQYSFLTKYGGHPQGGAAVRVFTAPESAAYEITGKFEDADTSCGDGIHAVIQSGATTLWQCNLPEDGTCSFDETVSLQAGDQLQFRIEPRANNFCDATRFAAHVHWTSPENHDWTIDPGNGPVTLPPGGFVAVAADLRAQTARLGHRSDAPIGDRVSCPAYDFARSRSGLAELDGLSTDGAIALVHGPLGDDIHGLALTQASWTSPRQKVILSASQRCDVNLRLLDSHRALLAVRRFAQPNEALDLTLGHLPQDWTNTLATKPDAVTMALAALDDNGDATPAGTFQTAPLDQHGNLQLTHLVEDSLYLLQVDLSCSGPDCCGNGVCNDNENCSTCPQDCPVAEYQICCDGKAVSGECCTDQDCRDLGYGEYCADYTCYSRGTDDPVFLEPDVDASSSSGDATPNTTSPRLGCGCGVALQHNGDAVPADPRPRNSLPWILSLLAVLGLIFRRRSQR